MSFGLNCSGIELKTLIILSPLSLGFYCPQMNPFTVTAADEKKLMAVPVRWERGTAGGGGRRGGRRGREDWRGREEEREKQHCHGCTAG